MGMSMGMGMWVATGMENITWAKATGTAVSAMGKSMGMGMAMRSGVANIT
jgi:hypothetical protein